MKSTITMFASAFLLTAATVRAQATTDIFSTQGTFNWICPPGVTSIQVECWGGGGAGGGSFVNGGSANSGGGGGGGGAYARLDSVAVTPGLSYVITIPAAATCPSSGFTNGQRFDGSPVSFTGDSVTITANGGQGGACSVVTGGTAISGSPGAGGAAGEGWDEAWKGGNAVLWGAGNGGGGGGGAGDLGPGGNSAALNGSSGAGGEGSDANHTGGNGGVSRNGAGAGNAAANPGGGGGGAKSTTTSTISRAGGRGGLGRIILTYTIPPPTVITKANNADDLNLGSSWVGGQMPSPTDLALWDSTVASANTTILGGDQTWSGMVIRDPAGPVSIGGANTLTLGNALVDIDLSAATVDLSVNTPIAMGSENIWEIADIRTLTLAGGISGNFPLTMRGAGTVRLAAGDLLPYGPDNGNLTVDATLDLNGHSQRINGLNGLGIVDNSAPNSTATLTVGGNNQSGTFDGILENSGSSAILNVVKTGSGAIVLNGENTLSGTVSITGGTLGVGYADSAGEVGSLDSATGISMSDGAILRAELTHTTIQATTPITLGGADTTATITAPLLPPNNTGASVQKVFNLNSVISGDGNLVLAGINAYNQYGRINLQAQNQYTGSTLITTLGGYGPSAGNANIFVRIHVDNALPPGTVVTLDGGDGGGGGRWCELDLNGYNQTLAGLTNVTGRNLRFQQVTNRAETASVLTINNNEPFTYAGQIGAPLQNGLDSAGNHLALTKNGAGVFTLSGANTYTGETSILGGTLELAANAALPAASAVAIQAATLKVGPAVSATSSGTLNCTGAANIHLGDDTSALAFGDSSGLDWAGSLTITGNFVSGASLRFGTDANGLTSSQLAAISGPGLSDIGIDASGYITATVQSGGYAAWAASNAGGQAAELDFDGDGVPNGVEYFLHAAAGFTALPALDSSKSITWTNGGNIPASSYGTQFVIQTSNDLVDWTDVPVGELETNRDGPAGTLRYTLGGASPRFVRLKVMPE